MIEQIYQMFGPAAPTVSKVLLHSLWQGSLVALVLATALVLLRRGSSQARYAAACLAMLLMVGLSVVSAFYIAGASGSAAPGPIVGNVAATSDVDVAAAAATLADTPESTAISGRTLQSLQQYIFPAWIAGVFLLSFYHLIGWRKVIGLTRRRTRPVSEAWQLRFERLCTTAAVKDAVSIVQSSIAKVPCVIGWVKPVILVPLGSFTGLDEEELELIILHELAHVRRHDVLMGYIQAIAEILFFFNPAVWWISRQIRTERENCCDDLAIALSGDRLRYARALTNLAQSSSSRTSLVAAADSAPLVQRVRRILGVPAEQGQPTRGSVGGVLLLATLLTLSFSLFSGTTYSDTKSETVLEVTEKMEPERGDIRGDWEIEKQARQFYVRIRFGRNWSTGFSIDADDFLRQVDMAGSNYKLKRDAGTFYLEGRFERDGDDIRGSGDCFFRADPEYVKAMEKLGYRLDDDDVLKLAVHDVSLDFAGGLDSLGYDDLSLNKLIEAHIHGVTPEFIGELEQLGYKNLRMNTLVAMRIHGAEPEYISELNRLGYTDLSPERLVQMRIHDVEPEFIEEMAKLGYGDLGPSKLVEMQIHDVDADFVSDLAKLGYDNLSESRLVEFKIHGVEPEYIESLAELGYKDLSPAKLVEFRIHGVTPRFIRDLAELGYRDVSPSRLVEMKIHNVTPAYIKKLRARGYDDLSTRELVEFRIHGR